MNFCDSQNFAAVQLWTFSGLDAARRLYESFGFRLTKEWQGEQWGSEMLEQQFTRNAYETSVIASVEKLPIPINSRLFCTRYQPGNYSMNF
jgi:hypothetical protein